MFAESVTAVNIITSTMQVWGLVALFDVFGQQPGEMA
jgi:hypothetical protein